MTKPKDFDEDAYELRLGEAARMQCDPPRIEEILAEAAMPGRGPDPGVERLRRKGYNVETADEVIARLDEARGWRALTFEEEGIYRLAQTIVGLR